LSLGQRGQCTGDFGQDFGLDRGADDFGDDVEHLAERGDAVGGGSGRGRGLPFSGEIAAGAELAERTIHFPVKAIHRFLTFFGFHYCGQLPQHSYRQNGVADPNKNRTNQKKFTGPVFERPIQHVIRPSGCILLLILRKSDYN
jgi:hypothetical protein